MTNGFWERFWQCGQYAFLATLFAFIAMPMIVIVVFSFDASRFPVIPWGGFSLSWYKAMLADPLVITAFANSLVISISTGVLSTVLGLAAAYVDYRYNFPGKAAFVLLIAVPPAVPVTILGMAMLVFTANIGLLGRIEAVVICHVVIATSFSMAIIRLRLGELSRDLEAAAWNLGASPAAALIHVVLPFCRSAVIASLFISAAISFDEFMIAWFVGGVHETISVRLLNQILGLVTPKINAIGTVVLVTSVALVVLAQLFVSARLSYRRGPAA
jgi:spermidine/putrescine transport system permease protein